MLPPISSIFASPAAFARNSRGAPSCRHCREATTCSAAIATAPPAPRSPSSFAPSIDEAEKRRAGAAAALPPAEAVAAAACAASLSLCVWVEHPRCVAAVALAIGRRRAAAFATCCFTRAASAAAAGGHALEHDSVGLTWLLPPTRGCVLHRAACTAPCDLVAAALLRLTSPTRNHDATTTGCECGDDDGDGARLAVLEFPHHSLARPVAHVIALAQAALKARASLHVLSLPWCTDPLPDALLDAMGRAWGRSLLRLGVSHPALARLSERHEDSTNAAAATSTPLPTLAANAAAPVRFLRACRRLEALKVRSAVDWPLLLPLLGASGPIAAQPASGAAQMDGAVPAVRPRCAVVVGAAAPTPHSGQVSQHADPFAGDDFGRPVMVGCDHEGTTNVRECTTLVEGQMDLRVLAMMPRVEAVPACWGAHLRRLAVRHLNTPIRAADIRAIAQHLPQLRELELTVSSFGGDPVAARMGVAVTWVAATPEAQAARNAEWAGAFEPLLQRLVLFETCSQCSTVFRALAASASAASPPLSPSAPLTIASSPLSASTWRDPVELPGSSPPGPQAVAPEGAIIKTGGRVGSQFHLPLRVLVLNAAVLRPFTTDVASEGLAAFGPRAPDLQELRLMAVTAAAVLRVPASFPNLTALSVRLVPDLTDADMVQLLGGLPLLRLLKLGAAGRVALEPSVFFPAAAAGVAATRPPPLVVARSLRRAVLPLRVEDNVALLRPAVFPRLRHCHFY